MISIPERLRRQAEKNELVVFVGAGVSRNSYVELDGVERRPDTWGQLLDRIAVELGLAVRREEGVIPVEENYKKLEQEGNLLDNAEYLRYYAKSKGRQSDIFYWVRQGVERPTDDVEFKPNDWHQAILNVSELGPCVTVTTNYDTLIERAFGEVGFVPYLYHEKNLLNSLSGGTHRPIFKLHGSIKKQDDRLILSSSDYRYLEDEGRLMLDVLRSLLMTRTALFVGYSMQDPDVNHILSSIFTKHSQKSQSQHFILHEESPLVDYRRDVLSNWYGVDVITYEVSETEGHSAGLEILQSIGQN